MPPGGTRQLKVHRALPVVALAGGMEVQAEVVVPALVSILPVVPEAQPIVLPPDPVFHPVSHLPLAPAAAPQSQTPVKSSKESLRCSDGKRRPVYHCTEAGCGKTFNRPARLERHMRTHTGERPFVCNMDGCDKSFPQAYALKRHQLTHTDERPFKCSEAGCNHAFQLSHHLHRHEALHREPKPYACTHDGCTERFSKHSQLLRHECSHTGELPYKCTLDGCEKAFAYPSLLKTHIGNVHAHTPKYVCGAEDCSQVFVSKRELNAHIKTVHPGSFTCAACGKEFKVASSLQDHEATHLIDRASVPCPFPGCSLSYSSTQNLRTHVKAIHEGVRPFKCGHPDCGMEFSYKQQWHLHEQRHNKKREMTEAGDEEPVKKAKTKKTLKKDEVEALIGSAASVSADAPVVPLPGYSY